MKDTLRISLLTLAVFVAGLLTGMLIRGMHHLPPPPFGPLDEIASHSPPWGGGGPKHFRLTPEKVAEMKAEMEKIRPEMDAFQSKLKAIETDFRTKLDAMLTPEQRKLLPPAPEMGRPQPGRGGPSPFSGPLEGLAIFTIIKPALDRMSDELKLTAPQQATLRQLLLDRRQRFLELVDSTPPPSLKLGRMLPPPPH